MQRKMVQSPGSRCQQGRMDSRGSTCVPFFFLLYNSSLEEENDHPIYLDSDFLSILQEDDVLFTLQREIGNHWAKVSVTYYPHASGINVTPQYH